MQDPIERIIEQVAIMTDDDYGVRIAREMVLKPKRTFQVEVVCRLVEQKQIWLGEQGCRQRNPHAPATGKFCTGPLLVFV
jgi:hypothetical protein